MASRRPPSLKAFAATAARAAAAETPDQLYALKGDLEAISAHLQPASCTGPALTAVLGSGMCPDLARATMQGLELLSKAPSATSEAARNLTDPLDFLSRCLLHIVSAAPPGKLKKLPPAGFLAAWPAAAAAAATYLQHHAQELPPSPATRSVLVQVVSLLRIWRVAALQHLNAPGTISASGPVIQTLPAAAELAVLLLTSPAAPAAFPQELAVASPDSQGGVKYLQSAAATTLHVMASLVATAGNTVMGPNPVLPAPFAHDSVQKALVLHLAAMMPHCVGAMAQQQQGRSSASSGGGSSKKAAASRAPAAAPPSAAAVAAADATAHAQLQHLNLQRQQDLQSYGRVACDCAGIAPGGADGDTPRGHLTTAYGGVQLAFVLRRQAMGHPLWPQLYRGSITQPSPAAAAGVLDSLLAPVIAPGVDPLLLQELLLHLVVVLGDGVSMSAGLGISINSLQPATPRSADKSRVAACLRLFWLDAGRGLLQAAGVAGEDLDADDAAEADVKLSLTDGTTLEKAVTANDLLTQAGYILLQTFVWHSEFLPPAQDLFKQQPQLATRVLEAAARACTWPAPHAPPQWGAKDAGKHVRGLYLAAAACKLDSAELVALAYKKPKLVQRCCSMMVSALKQAQQQLAGAAGRTLPGWHVHVLPQLLSLANLAACMGADFWAAAGQGGPAHAASSWGPGGVNAFWLALSGRGLAAVGRVLASAPAATWLQESMRAGASSTRTAALQQLASHGQALAWISDQLALLRAVLQESSRAADAAGCALPAADAGAVRKLQAQAAALSERWQPLKDACTAALASDSSNQQQVAALVAFAAACGAGGWLPDALIELGNAVWSLLPNKLGCNDPECDSLQGLTEASSAKKACMDCKVARYCCKTDQLRAWPAHKKSCKAIKKALAASSDC